MTLATALSRSRLLGDRRVALPRIAAYAVTTSPLVDPDDPRIRAYRAIRRRNRIALAAAVALSVALTAAIGALLVLVEPRGSVVKQVAVALLLPPFAGAWLYRRLRSPEDPDRALHG